MPEPSFGVVLLNWQNANLTVESLDSLLAADPRPAHVVVVDNGSKDDSLERLRGWAKANKVTLATRLPGDTRPFGEWLVIVPAPDNRGFSAGNNHGIRVLRDASDVTHILLLNNDAGVRTDTFTELANALTQRPDAGMLTGTIYVDRGEHDRDEIWYSGGYEQPLRGLVLHETTAPENDEIRPVEFVSACAMLISRPVLVQIGELPECYFPLYGEDAEYSRRTRLGGFPVLYAPRAVFFHKVGATVGRAQVSALITHVQVRNRLFYIRRNLTGAQRAIAMLYMLATKPARAVVETLRGRPSIGWALLRGTAAGLFASADDARPTPPGVRR